MLDRYLFYLYLWCIVLEYLTSECLIKGQQHKVMRSCEGKWMVRNLVLKWIELLNRKPACLM